jgi:hypothetical protein|tara:strand:+ start:2838 stop:3137 length:300 start_codon:yes stop_codon:yes gene_type:complete
MSTNVNFAYASATASGDAAGLTKPLLKVQNDVALTDTRVQGVHATGVGVFTISDAAATKIKFTSVEDAEIYIADSGVRFDGAVTVVFPTTASTVAVQYG